MISNLRVHKGLWMAGVLGLVLGGWAGMPRAGAAEESAATEGPGAGETAAPAEGNQAEQPAAPAEEGPKISKIEFKGLQHVPEHNVRDVIKSRVGEVFNNDTLQEDVDAIANLGYFVGPDVEPPGVQALPEALPDGSIRITFELVEYPLIKGVELEGNHLFSDEELRATLKFLRPGQVLNINNLEPDLENLENYYQERDYVAFVSLGDPPIDEDGIMHLVIEEVKIHQIRFVFVDAQNKPTTRHATKEKVLRREMESRPGDYFSSRRLSDDLRRIFNLGLFEDVRRKGVDPVGPNTVDVTIEVREQPRTSQVGGGITYSSRYGVVGFASVSMSNLQGMARQARAEVYFGNLRSYDLSLFEPWLDRHHTSLNLNVYDTTGAGLNVFTPNAYGDYQYSRDYDQRRQGFRVGLSRPLDWDTRAGFELKSESVAIERSLGSEALPSLPPFPFQELGSDSTRSISLSLTQDTRDVVFDPSMGSRLSLNTEFAGRTFGGDNDFTKYILEFRKYWPIGSGQVATESEERKVPRTVLASRVKYGGSSGSLPFSQVYFVGGADTLRGYEEDRWFGNRMFLANLEYRYRFQPSLQGAVFFDIGRAWREGESLNFPDSLASAYGIGVRIKTPLGPMRLDYGIGADGSRTSFGFLQPF